MADEATQIQIDTLRGQLREEKEYAEALHESKQDAERILSSKIAALSSLRAEHDTLLTGLRAEVERLRRIQMHEEGMRGQWEREAPLQDDQAWAAQQVAGASKEAADRLENLLRESEGSDDGA